LLFNFSIEPRSSRYLNSKKIVFVVFHICVVDFGIAGGGGVGSKFEAFFSHTHTLDFVVCCRL
jgi:hypothetical protein